MKACPKCDNELVRIVYGEPTLNVFKQAQAKKIFLGGCVIYDDETLDPIYYCYNCEKSFFKNLEESN